MSASLTRTAASVPSRRASRAVTGRRFDGHSGVLGLIDLWWERAGQRRRLAEMDAHMLKDIGLSRADAEAEAKKPFWVA